MNYLTKTIKLFSTYKPCYNIELAKKYIKPEQINKQIIIVRPQIKYEIVVYKENKENENKKKMIDKNNCCGNYCNNCIANLI